MVEAENQIQEVQKKMGYKNNQLENLNKDEEHLKNKKQEASDQIKDKREKIHQKQIDIDKIEVQQKANKQSLKSNTDLIQTLKLKIDNLNHFKLQILSEQQKISKQIESENQKMTDFKGLLEQNSRPQLKIAGKGIEGKQHQGSVERIKQPKQEKQSIKNLEIQKESQQQDIVTQNKLKQDVDNKSNEIKQKKQEIDGFLQENKAHKQNKQKVILEKEQQETILDEQNQNLNQINKSITKISKKNNNFTDRIMQLQIEQENRNLYKDARQQIQNNVQESLNDLQNLQRQQQGNVQQQQQQQLNYKVN
ncbi:hypothetical protein pb186bvf_006319 [Paramecium bursaria]